MILLKIIYAIICGSIIGIERELKNKAAGLKTNVLICLGSMLFIESILFLNPVSDSIARIIAQIATGIGFIGAGCILRNDNKVSGLTTASIVWIVASLGILIGINQGPYAVLIAFIVTILMLILNFIENKFLHAKDDNSKKR